MRTNRRWTCWILAGFVATAPLLAAAEEAGTSITVKSPEVSLGRTRELLDQTAIEVLTALDYEERQAKDEHFKLATTVGLESTRFFVKALSASTRRTLELAITPHAGGGYAFYGYGVEISADGKIPNPDLPLLQKKLEALVAAMPKERKKAGAKDYAYETIQLSYVQVDRALALLKALGVSTIEFKASEGETWYEKVFAPVESGEKSLPLVAKIIDSPKTSLMDPFDDPTKRSGSSSSTPSKKDSAVPDIGGTFLHGITSGDSPQRLLLVYDKREPESIEPIVNLLHDKIDEPARQIVIEALVIEINTDTLKDIGVRFGWANGESQGGFGYGYGTDGAPSTSSSQIPFTFLFDKAADIANSLKVSLSALVSSGEAEILSSPSVLVLDGRQARIQVGQQVPVISTVIPQGSGTTKESVDYFPVGIVLNLRPRINDRGDEITMQVETIVSAIAHGGTTEVARAPTVDNRQVQTFVRVADNTPFIIGGLISTDRREERRGVPFLSDIPLLGALFREKTVDGSKREVIVVITPHVIPVDEKNFRFVIPKEAPIFDSFGHKLFRNAYRIQSRDVYDLKFVTESKSLKEAVERVKKRAESDRELRDQEPFASLLADKIPGEQVLVHRMLYEIVRRTGFYKLVGPDKIIVFEKTEIEKDSFGFQVERLEDKLAALPRNANALSIRFDANPLITADHPFAQPAAVITPETVSRKDYDAKLMAANPRTAAGDPDDWTVLLGSDFPGRTSPYDALRIVLVMKQILTLNSSLDPTIANFYVGRQILFPTEEDVRESTHVVDPEAAQLFYEVQSYYPAFEREFNRTINQIDRALGGAKAAAK